MVDAGGSTQLFWVGVCYMGIQKWSIESGFSLKMRGLGNKIGKICILRAEILAKTRLKMQSFSKI